MIRISMLFLALLISSSLACSQKKGYVANGLFKKPTYLVENCGSLYSAFRKQIPNTDTIKYLELYIVAPGKMVQASSYLQNTLDSKNYFQVQAKLIPGTGGHAYGYTNGEKVINLTVGKVGDFQVAILAGDN